MRLSNGLDPDSVGPDLGPNSLQRLSAEIKERVNNKVLIVYKQTKSAWTQIRLLPWDSHCLLWRFPNYKGK